MTEKLTQDDIEAIRKRTEAATDGPWHVSNHRANEVRQPKSAKSRKFSTCCDHDGFLDADFIANAREDIPKLLTEVDRLQRSRAEIYAEAYAQGRFDERKEADGE